MYYSATCFVHLIRRDSSVLRLWSWFILFHPRNEYTRIYFPSTLFTLTGIWQSISLYKPPKNHMQEFLQGIYLQTKWLGHRAGTFSNLLGHGGNIVSQHNSVVLSWDSGSWMTGVYRLGPHRRGETASEIPSVLLSPPCPRFSPQRQHFRTWAERQVYSRSF